MNSKYYSLRKLVLATLALGALAQPAIAYDKGDFTIYPGSACHPQGVQNNPSLSIGFDGAIYNVSTTSDVTVDCPFVRDNVQVHEKPTSVLIRSKDNNPLPGALGAIRCSLFSRDSEGQLFASAGGHSDNQNEFKAFSVGPLPYRDFGDLAFGYMHLQCVIPKAVIDSAGVKHSSSIQSYQVGENLDTNLCCGGSFYDEEL